MKNDADVMQAWDRNSEDCIEVLFEALRDVCCGSEMSVSFD